MKSYLAITLSSLMLISCTTDRFQINGFIDGAEKTTVYLQEVVNNSLVTIDSTSLREGKFRFRGRVKTPDLYGIKVGSNEDLILLFLENSTISITGNYDRLSESKVEGSSNHDLIVAFNHKFEEKNQKIQDITFRYQSAAMNGILTPSLEEDLISEYNAANEEILSFIKGFVKENNKSVVAAFITMRHLVPVISVEALDSIVSTFPESIHTSTYVTQAKEMLEVEKRNAIGQPYTDFTLPDTNGKPITLSNLVGSKYLLVDFWAAWCGPCRNKNPQLVELYSQYKEKGLEIIGVSLDNSRDAWINAITQDGLTWLQVSDLRGWESDVARLYGIRSIPANVLLDSNGIIVAKNLRDSQFQEKFSELMP